MIKKIAFAVALILLLSPLSAFCYQKTTSLTDREIIERLTRLEEEQKILREEMNRRFEQRFDEMDKRITDLVHTANTMMVVFGGLVVAMMGCLYFELAEVMKTFGIWVVVRNLCTMMLCFLEKAGYYVYGFLVLTLKILCDNKSLG